MSEYLNYDCINCGRHRVENNGICEKCNFDNILNEFAQPVLECLEHGAGTCRNADLIDTLRAELARRDKELSELNDKAVFIQFENEDELPSEIQDDVYSAMFECSHVNGVRLFPYIEENGQKYFLVMLKEDI